MEVLFEQPVKSMEGYMEGLTVTITNRIRGDAGLEAEYGRRLDEAVSDYVIGENYRKLRAGSQIFVGCC
jgi:hypothetical protein